MVDYLYLRLSQMQAGLWEPDKPIHAHFLVKQVDEIRYLSSSIQ